MAEALKHYFSPLVVAEIAHQIAAVYPAFNSRGFSRAALKQFAQLELMARAKQIAAALQQYLPADYPAAVAIIVASLGPKLEQTQNNGLSPFFYLPHAFFVSQYGLDFFEESMAAQYEITQRFTAEFSIRAFLLRYPEQTLARLAQWASDPSVHVRRLVSEGTRPRLPWAQRLPHFQCDPSALIPLLEKLKNDPELYVRRSVANHLNDIGKDNPQLLLDIAKRWQSVATANEIWVIKHALRFVVKKGDSAALAILGYTQQSRISILERQIAPAKVKAGQSVTLSAQLRNASAQPQALMVDFRVFYIKANGRAAPKVFKLKSLVMPAKATVVLSKSLSLGNMTTRKHYSGEHKVEMLINGQAFELGSFILVVD